MQSMIYATLMYTTFVPINIFAFEATMGLYDINSEKISILNDSVFTGTVDNMVKELWCEADEHWDVCIWFWTDHGGNNCTVIDDTNVHDCTDESIIIDKEGKECSLTFSKGFIMDSHEGFWECRLGTQLRLKQKFKVKMRY